MLELIHLLDLEPALVLIQNSHPAARNRFVYFPETGLTRLPSSILSLLSSQISKRRSLGSLLPSVLAEPFKSSNRPLGLTDESFDQFISRRFGPEFARRFVCVLLLDQFGMPKTEVEAASSEEYFEDDKATSSRIRSLEGWLRNDPRVEVRAGSSVHAAKRSEDGDIVLETSTGEVKVSHLVSTLPLSRISNIISSLRQVLDMGTSPYSTVHVVNMVFSPGQFPIHPPGFGYLVPRPEAGYDSADNPVLGCVFDSATVSIHKPTVLTLMLGGPFPIRSTQLSMEYILSLLSRHLGHERLPEPIVHRYHIHHDCIPTPLVGHLERISTLREAVQQEWAGSLEIIGSGVGGVSLGDCVRDGRAASINIARRLQSGG
ncbi:Flavin containing amine oxidoreductase [Rhizoctonia solani]|uniref:Flavin containing amine oxidoreductase n=1 Tax=Rhizoctonia solani TaxID=456999 RepID=A0A8H8NYW0_9AGAM|nr:Flavin containing amine oxidoreductase [Rhizoctonia solani]QRW21195.1 Flavin containing amine oxidoreductase [Rhizoctonia solani]